jgi:CubicO group peptidase (beta-lactamase class C family)
MRFPFAAGGLCSTVGDLAAWTRALESGKVVAAAAYEKMTTEARTEAGGPTH